MKKIIFLLFYLFLTLDISAQHPISAQSMALGGVGVTFQDVNSLFANPAGASFAQNPGVSVNAERRFSLSALNTYTAGFVYPSNSGSFGILLNYFGFDVYNQQQIGLVYSRKFAKNLSFGAEIDFHNFKIENYGTRSIVSFQIGAQYQLLNKVIIGFNLSNPIRQEVAEGENLASVIKLGLVYSASKKINLHAEAEQDLDFPVRIKLGIDYQIIEAFYARLGMGTNPSMVHFGMGLKLDNVKIDASASYHQILGLSPSIGVRYEINRR